MTADNPYKSPASEPTIPTVHSSDLAILDRSRRAVWFLCVVAGLFCLFRVCEFLLGTRTLLLYGNRHGTLPFGVPYIGFHWGLCMADIALYATLCRALVAYIRQIESMRVRDRATALFVVLGSIWNKLALIVLIIAVRVLASSAFWTGAARNH